MQAELLRLIAYQQVTLSPDVKRSDKPIRISSYVKFPTDKKIDLSNLPNIETLREAWKVKI